MAFFTSETNSYLITGKLFYGTNLKINGNFFINVVFMNANFELTFWSKVLILKTNYLINYVVAKFRKIAVQHPFNSIRQGRESRFLLMKRTETKAKHCRI